MNLEEGGCWRINRAHPHMTVSLFVRCQGYDQATTAVYMTVTQGMQLVIWRINMADGHRYRSLR